VGRCPRRKFSRVSLEVVSYAVLRGVGTLPTRLSAADPRAYNAATRVADVQREKRCGSLAVIRFMARKKRVLFAIGAG